MKVAAFVLSCGEWCVVVVLAVVFVWLLKWSPVVSAVVVSLQHGTKPGTYIHTPFIRSFNDER